MAVRNFWITLDIDGRKTRVATGPRRKDGGFDMTIYIRNEGSIERALVIQGWERSGELTITAGSKDQQIAVKTKR